MESSTCHPPAKLICFIAGVFAFSIVKTLMDLPEGEQFQSVGSVSGCHLPSCVQGTGVGGRRGHGWPPLGRSPVDLVVEGLLHGGYFLLGINLSWKDLATLVLPYASSPHLLAYSFPRMLFSCL